MKKLLAVASLGLLGIVIPSAGSNAATEPVAPCTDGFYQVISGQLAEFDPSTNSYLPLGADQPNYNAMGFRVADGNLYAIQGSTLLRIDLTGAVTPLGTVNIVPGSYTGDFGDDGMLHVSRGGGDWYAIDVETLAATRQAAFTSNLGVADIVNVAGTFYGVSSTGTLWAFSPATGTTTNLGPVAGIPASGSVFGAAWTTAGSNLYVGRNSGEIYQITGYSTGLPVATQVGSGPSTSSNDGASCPYAVAPAGLADVDGPVPEVAPSTPQGLAAAASYEAVYEAPQFSAPDAGLGTGAACDATIAQDQPARASTAPISVTQATTLLDESFDAAANGFAVMSGSWLVEGGAYRQLNTCEYDLMSVLTNTIVDHFDLDVVFSSPTVPNQGGVVFNVSSTNSRSGAIVVDLADDGATLRWGTYDELGYYQNIGWDLISAPAANEPVSLRIESRGDAYTIIHNGNTVVTETTPYPGGMIGLVASQSEVAFQQVILTAVPS